MEFLVVLIVLFLVEAMYFKLAFKYRIFDKPNRRSSHTKITLRGGGVIFYIGALIYFIYSGFAFPYFFIGLTLLSVVSFIDDISEVSYKIRLVAQLIASLLVFQELNLFESHVLWVIPALILVVGTINAYNFMDGINGLMAWSSIVVLGLLEVVNYNTPFIEDRFIIYVLLSALVFAFFNFRGQAKCFAGDIGSVSMALIVIFLIGKLVVTTGSPIYILFLAVYGIETVWTIVRRLFKGENIFKPHRIHLFQILSNEAGVNKLYVSFIYGLVQLLIGISVIEVQTMTIQNQLVFSVALLGLMSLVYLLIKKVLMNQHNLS
ncbi:glycosyltransferase family 4 protein [Myroides marinus]|uniref:MraY family glycosyltransferase n=1 Tax=Myroides marinus TaxID=703342 RepID=UPI002577EE0F|nr:glycosyltransferase family 4 protein [Myroides marinus]MDM1503170.1 glycosyltransferase family 4 protein [Myroides marinus]